MTTVEQMAEVFARYGIDPSDPRYQREVIFGAGDVWASCCWLHAVSRPRAECDLRMAIVAELRERGVYAALCVSCRWPVADARRCEGCENRNGVVGRSRRRRGERMIADGNGCVDYVSRAELAFERQFAGADI